MFIENKQFVNPFIDDKLSKEPKNRWKSIIQTEARERCEQNGHNV